MAELDNELTEEEARRIYHQCQAKTEVAESALSAAMYEEEIALSRLSVLVRARQAREDEQRAKQWAEEKAEEKRLRKLRDEEIARQSAERIRQIENQDTDSYEYKMRQILAPLRSAGIEIINLPPVPEKHSK